ncbi:hypothetical protein PG996_009771 [Apiospora saccharicola]|uniref:Uncharacterized protein n=1 Tax=Apiospora saccharicola TaxID=335842 RepID=A0ABR1UP73_9PEZI
MYAPQSKDGNDWGMFIQNWYRKVYGKAKGLLEIRGELAREESLQKAYVTLTHRSVVEFLDNVHAHTIMDQWNIEFDPFQATMRGFLAFLKHNTSRLSSRRVSEIWLKRPDNDWNAREPLKQFWWRFRRLIHLSFLEDRSNVSRLMKLLHRVEEMYDSPTTGGNNITANTRNSDVLLLTLLSGCYEYYDWLLDQGLMLEAKAEPNCEVHRYAYLFKHIIQFRALEKGHDLSKYLPTPVRRYNRVMSRFIHLGADLNHVYKESKERMSLDNWRLRSNWTLWQISFWEMFTDVSIRPDEEGIFDVGHNMDQLLRNGADPSLRILESKGPLEETEVAWLIPKSGWICFQLFSETSLPESWAWVTAEPPQDRIVSRLRIKAAQLHLGHIFIIRLQENRMVFSTYMTLWPSSQKMRLTSNDLWMASTAIPLY